MVKMNIFVNYKSNNDKYMGFCPVYVRKKENIKFSVVLTVVQALRLRTKKIQKIRSLTLDLATIFGPGTQKQKQQKQK